MNQTTFGGEPRNTRLLERLRLLQRETTVGVAERKAKKKEDTQLPSNWLEARWFGGEMEGFPIHPLQQPGVPGIPKPPIQTATKGYLRYDVSSICQYALGKKKENTSSDSFPICLRRLGTQIKNQGGVASDNPQKLGALWSGPKENQKEATVGVAERKPRGYECSSICEELHSLQKQKLCLCPVVKDSL